MLPARLLRGYASFRTARVDGKQSRWQQLAEVGQSPDTAVVACCDSRAAPEILFDARPGELFVIRNIANLVPPFSNTPDFRSTSASIEFAVAGLNVSHLVVMGHGRCGGIAAALEGRDQDRPTDFIGQWMSLIRPLIHACGCLDHQDPERRLILERASVLQSIANLRTFPWIRERERVGRLALHGAWFDIGLGELWAYDEPGDRWSLLSASDEAGEIEVSAQAQG